MRQGQPQNRQRSRGRGNNNRNNNNNRNQLNRSMESNGPDVRIRGTAAHIAEKYTQLARDAQTSGDAVAAESYWQFAEHYNRLIAIAQAAQAEQQAQRDEERARRMEEKGEETREDGDENREGRSRGRGRSRRNRDQEGDSTENVGDAVAKGDGPQPVITDTPAEVVLGEKPAEAQADADSAPAKPRRARRPRKTEEAGPAAADDAAGLPAFVTGAE